MKYLVALFLMLMLLACSEGGTGSSSPNATDTSFRVKTIRDVEPGLAEADSIQIVFYDDPHGDSLRAYRFFSYIEVNQRPVIDSLVKAIDTVFVQESKTRSCRSHGKLILLKGTDIIKTVYFGLDAKPCSYFYLIRDGQFFYVPLNESTRSMMERWRAAARGRNGRRGESPQN